MRRSVAGPVFAVSIVSCAWSSAFLTYSQWDALDADRRALYLAGAFDSLVGYSGTGDHATELHYFLCIHNSGMDHHRLADNVRTYAAARTELQNTVQKALLSYLIAFCGKPPS